MFLSFDDGKHWVDLYRSRCQGDVLPVQMRICTKFKPEGRTIPSDVRTLDAIHLASALLWRDAMGVDPVMATHDAALGLAAQAHGLTVLGT
jgi:hypothetical protein